MEYNQNLEPIYLICKEVYENQITKNEGVKKLVEKVNMKLNSAKIIIPLYLKLATGEKFTRTLSVELFEYFLARILNDYGTPKLSLALSALRQHIEYIAEKGDSKIKLKLVLELYSNKLNSLENLTEVKENKDEIEQDEIISILKKTKNRQEVILELEKLTEKEPEIIIIGTKSYKRDNKTIAQIKYIRNSECQICGNFILKSNGEKYIEAAHIKPKREKGQELPENIILLCPNHHKEFDLGNRKIINHNKSFIEFSLNDKNYKISIGII